MNFFRRDFLKTMLFPLCGFFIPKKLLADDRNIQLVANVQVNYDHGECLRFFTEKFKLNMEEYNNFIINNKDIEFLFKKALQDKDSKNISRIDIKFQNYHVYFLKAKDNLYYKNDMWIEFDDRGWNRNLNSNFETV